MRFGRKHITAGLRALVCAGLFPMTAGWIAHADLGERVSNTAFVTQSTESSTLVLPTNEAAFTIEARATPSDVEFFRIIENAPDAVRVQLNGSDYSPSGEMDGPFSAFDDVSLLGQKTLDRSRPVDLVPAQTYLAGELMVVRVVDLGQNGNSDRIETVALQITADTGDRITLRLYEDQPNSGHFYGFFPSTSAPTSPNDRTITAPQDTVLTATYTDVFDANEVSTDTALVDPFGRVFDSFTGAPLDRVSVTILDADTGQPAEILGIDGSGQFPATVETGEAVRASNGVAYPEAPGVFFFPILPPGRYRIEVAAPEGYLYPSARSAAEFETLPNAPFDIWTEASFGRVFEHTQSGPLNVDIPLDPNGELTIQKRATDVQAAIGDFVGYTIEIENAGNVPAPLQLQDTLPEGFRYVSGSARLDGVPVEDPTIQSDGRRLSFGAGAILPGMQAQLSYLTAVGPGTPLGEAVNRIVAVNAAGAPLSNPAEAGVYIEEDLLSSKATLIGRVVESACQPEEDWARSLQDGEGVAGVRLYMETGRYVVTDAHGLFHFEAVAPGSHIVQVDEATLPAGYEPVLCEENTRYAGSAISKFVDVQGGSVWRANFYLRRTSNADATTEVPEAMSGTPDHFDQQWLDRQAPTALQWAYPETDETPDGRSIDIGLLHPSDQHIELRLNGRPVAGLNYAGIGFSASRAAALSRWSGVDILPGRNVLTARAVAADGATLTRIQREIWFVDEVARVRMVDDQSVRVADGRTRPRIAVRVEDGDGHPVHQGRLIDVSVADPYRLAREAEEEFESPIDAAFSAVSAVRVGRAGIALIELEPTLESGRVQIQVKRSDGTVEIVEAWLEPEKRDWIFVGLAEAEGTATHLEKGPEHGADVLDGDGRIAFFAKGVVKGDWLLTLALDTAKRRGGQDGEIFDEIDPNAYYTLYGDRTWQNNNAESRYPVYVKLEKKTFQAVFGDYETGFNETDLGRYARRLSGLKTDYESEDVSITAFASETQQRFVKDELAADGTSGPFRLTVAPLVRSSEVIVVETRDRFRSDQILNTRFLNRYIDYEIDYTTGEVFFRQPVSAADTGLNPNVIVIDYETSEAGERGVTAGLRTETRFAGGAVQTGVTLLHEDDGASQGREGSNLIAADLRIAVDQSTELRAEYASTDADTEAGQSHGDAMLVEATRRTEKTNITGYFREEGAGFGLGQQASSTAAIRRYGAQLSSELNRRHGRSSDAQQVRRLNAQAYQETNLSVNARRSVADIVLEQDSQSFGASLGLRAVAEDFETDAAPRQSVLALAGLRRTFIERGLTLSATVEQPVQSGGDNDDEATLFPGRTILGLDQSLGRRATASLRHEVTNGSNASGQNTIAGISWTPRGGTELRASTDMITNESGRRLGATVGVDQTWQINSAWAVSAGAARRANVNGNDAPLAVTPDAAISPLEDGVRSVLTGSEQYTSAYFGVGYQTDRTAVSGRAEARESTTGTRRVMTLGGAREVSQTLSFSAAGRLQDEDLEAQSNREQADLRLGAAWRPRGEGVVVFNRLDLGHLNEAGVQDRGKIVNNLAVNAMLTPQTQLALYHGVKRVEIDFEGTRQTGITHLIGTEMRHDISPQIDLGIQATWSASDASETGTWSFGPSVGFSPQSNLWLTLGWNVSGFEDDDFEAARNKAQGPYIKLRAKFDQSSMKSLIGKLGLNGA